MDSLRSIVSKINKKDKSVYNILTFPTHEGYQSMLDKTGHRFYLLSLEGRKKWNSKFRPVPENHEVVNLIYDDMSDVDFILSHERFGQLQTALQISKQTRVPVIHVEHIEPQDDLLGKQKSLEMREIKGDLNVYISKHNRDAWGVDVERSTIVNHGIDTKILSGWEYSHDKKTVLYVVNQLESRDYFCGYKQWMEIKKGVEDKIKNVSFKLVGDNPGISKPVSDINELANEYRSCGCYLNTSQFSPIPMTVLEAMSCGCPVISTAKQEIPSIINGDNGFCSNEINELVDGICRVLSEKEYAEKLSCGARETIKNDFSEEGFLNQWNQIFDSAYKMNYGEEGLYA